MKFIGTEKCCQNKKNNDNNQPVHGVMASSNAKVKVEEKCHAQNLGGVAAPKQCKTF